jgi:hypothetical protein
MLASLMIGYDKSRQVYEYERNTVKLYVIFLISNNNARFN